MAASNRQQPSSAVSFADSALASPSQISSRSKDEEGNGTQASWKKSHHRRATSLLTLPSLNSLGSFLSSAGLADDTNKSGAGSLSTDAELIISDPTPTEWADEVDVHASSSPTSASFSNDRDCSPTLHHHDNDNSKLTDKEHRAASSGNRLSEEVRFRGPSRRALQPGPSSSPTTSTTTANKSSIAFPAPSSPPISAQPFDDPHDYQRRRRSRPSSYASSSRDSDLTAFGAAQFGSPDPSSASSADTPATSVRYSPRQASKHIDDYPPSESTIKGDARSSYQRPPMTSQNSSPSHFRTLPRSFANRAPAMARTRSDDTGSEEAFNRTYSLSAASGRRAANILEDALASEEKTVQRSEGFRARSINSIRGLAAAWVPARFAPSTTSQSAPTSSDESSLKDPNSPPRRDVLALVSTTGNEGKKVALKENTEHRRKKPVKLDRRRLDKAVTLAVEAAQAAEEDERVWTEKNRAKKALQARKASRNNLRSSEQQMVLASSAGESSGADDIDDEASDEEDEDLGFSLDLYISSLGYLISAISDKEAPGLSEKQRQDIKQRLEEGMSKLGFDARAELEAAEALKRELEVEKEKLALREQVQQQQPANIIHHHYHTTVPNQSLFGDASFSRAHAAAKASSQTSSSLAGKIGTSVLDIGLCIGAGALSAVSANLSAIAPRSLRNAASSSNLRRQDEPRITDLETDEELKATSASSSPRLTATAPPSGTNSGAATPRSAWTRAIGQNNRQWELAVAFASSAASALASSLGAVARSEYSASLPNGMEVAGAPNLDPQSPEYQAYIAQHGYHMDGTYHPPSTSTISAEDRLILLSASLARALKRSPLPGQLYQLLKQIVAILAAIDARYNLTEKGTQIALRETSRALRFVRKHDLHVKAVRVAWAAAEAAVAALEAYRDEKGWLDLQQSGNGSFYQSISKPASASNPASNSPASRTKELPAITDKDHMEVDLAEKAILDAANGNAMKQKSRVSV